MKQRKQRLILEQTEKKILPYIPLIHIIMPPEGWINTIRKALNISLRQLGNKLGVSAQAVKGLEISEKNRTITLQSLDDLAKAIDMKLVYALVPIDGSLEELLNKKATYMAQQIVNRTSNTMKLEDQENSSERLEKAVMEKIAELIHDIPKSLWD
jgi:predicted DNA-binding mobile mystery protein A